MAGVQPGRARRQAPEPLETDDVRAIAIGTVLWGLAFLLQLPFASRLNEAGYGEWLWTYLAGFGLGLLGIHYCRRRREALRRSRCRREEEREAPLQEPLT